MAYLTGEDVISAVSKNIRARFSESALKKIYKNLPQQNAHKPYAFIHLINAEHKNELKSTATWTFMLDIRVHPEDERTDVQSWAREVALNLIEAINFITVDNQLVKARSVEYRVEQEVLHFMVSYSYRVIHTSGTTQPHMLSVDYGEKLKNI